MAKNLTQVAINNFLKSKEKKLSDGMVKGLQLVKLSKGCVWRLRYKYGNKDTTVKIGDYPDVSLKVARELARNYRELLAKGVDPVAHKRKKLEEIKREQNKKTFEEVSKEYLAIAKKRVSESRFKKNYLRAFDKYANPFFGFKKIDEITRYDIIDLLKWIPKVKLQNATRTKNKTHTAKLIFGYVKNCLDYALNMGYIDYNPAYGIDVSKILEPEIVDRMRAVVDEEGIREIYKKIVDYSYDEGRYLMQFQALTALRNVGLYRLKWEYINWDKKLIIYPEGEYKGNKNEYVLPLTETLEGILRFFKNIYGKSKYVFRDEKINEESLSNRLRKYYQILEIKNHTPHGWRSSFKSIATEKRLGSYEAIEMQLGHTIGNKVQNVYFRTHLIDERRELLKKWENFLYNGEKE